MAGGTYGGLDMDILDGDTETEEGVWRGFDPISSHSVKFLESA